MSPKFNPTNFNPRTDRHRVRGAPGVYPRQYTEANLPPLIDTQQESICDDDCVDDIEEGADTDDA